MYGFYPGASEKVEAICYPVKVAVHYTDYSGLYYELGAFHAGRSGDIEGRTY